MDMPINDELTDIMRTILVLMMGFGFLWKGAKNENTVCEDQFSRRRHNVFVRARASGSGTRRC